MCKSTINIHLDLCAQCSSGKCGRILATHEKEWIRAEQKIGLEYWIFIIWTTSAFYVFKFFSIVLNCSLWPPPSSSFAYYLFSDHFSYEFFWLFVFLSAHQLVSCFGFLKDNEQIWSRQRFYDDIILVFMRSFWILVGAHFN